MVMAPWSVHLACRSRWYSFGISNNTAIPAESQAWRITAHALKRLANLDSHSIIDVDAGEAYQWHKVSALTTHAPTHKALGADLWLG
eukprot:m.57891 g.57891  ORF g.57891 m.57891 type:complete len:87 (+) comp11639_c1_seq1:2511-2771(+)